MNPLSVDLRRRIVERYQKGDVTYAEVAAWFHVGEATVSRLLRRSREREDFPLNCVGLSRKPSCDDLHVAPKPPYEKPSTTPCSVSGRINYSAGLLTVDSLIASESHCSSVSSHGSRAFEHCRCTAVPMVLVE